MFPLPLRPQLLVQCERNRRRETSVGLLHAMMPVCTVRGHGSERGRV